MIRDLVRRFVARLWPDHSGQLAALDGGPGPECPRPLAGVRLVRLPVDPDVAAADLARAMEGFPTVDLALSFCDFDAEGRCVAHVDCHLPDRRPL